MQKMYTKLTNVNLHRRPPESKVKKESISANQLEGCVVRPGLYKPLKAKDKILVQC